MNSRGRKILVALAAPALFIALVELVLWIFGAGDPKPHFVPDPVNSAKLTRSPRYRDFFAAPPPPFLLTKPVNGFRVFVIGESTVAGYPYFYATLCDWLQAELSDLLPSKTVEVVNAGFVGWTTFRLLDVLDEALRHSPDVVVWMVGHNEERVADSIVRARERQVHPARASVGDVLRHLRIARWFFSLRPNPPLEFPAHQRRDTPRVGAEIDLIRSEFRQGLDTVIDRVTRAGARLLLTTMPLNARQIPPGGSSSGVHLTPEAREKAALALVRAKDADQGQRFDQALASIDEVLAADPSSADAHWFRARALEALGRCDDARAAFDKSVELDFWPTRARAWVQSAIREKSSAPRVVLVDLKDSFDKNGHCGVAGSEWLCDDVHPNLPGHRAIAGFLLQALVNSAIPVQKEEFRFDLLRSEDAIRVSFGAAETEAFAENRALGYAKLFEALTYPESAASERLVAAREASTRLRQANQSMPGDVRVEILLGTAEILMDEPAGAPRLRAAVRRDAGVQAEFTRLVEASAQLRQIFAHAGVTAKDLQPSAARH